MYQKWFLSLISQVFVGIYFQIRFRALEANEGDDDDDARDWADELNELINWDDRGT